jgi:hypothetical protein
MWRHDGRGSCGRQRGEKALSRMVSARQRFAGSLDSQLEINLNYIINTLYLDAAAELPNYGGGNFPMRKYLESLIREK